MPYRAPYLSRIAKPLVQAEIPDTRTIDWQALSTDIAQELENMFDIRITDVLASAWEDYQELTESADPTKHPANEMISLPIVDHAWRRL